MAFGHVGIISMRKATEKKFDKNVYVPRQKESSSFPPDKLDWAEEKKKQTGKIMIICSALRPQVLLVKLHRIFSGKQVQALYANIWANTLGCPRTSYGYRNNLFICSQTK